MPFAAAHSTWAVEGKDVQGKLVMNLASGTALVDDASGKGLSSKHDDGSRSEASCSTATGFTSTATSSSWSSAQSSGIGFRFFSGSEKRFADLLDDVGGDSEVGSSNVWRVPDVQCQPIFEEESLKPMGFSDIVFKLNQESGPFCNFPSSVLLAAAPKRLGDMAPIVFYSRMFEINFGHVINDATMNQCFFNLFDATGFAAKPLESFRDAIGKKGSQCEEAFAIQVTMRNNVLPKFRMKLVDVDDEPFIVAVEDTAHGVERWDALMSQHFFYSAPMERQLLDRH